LKLKYDWCAGNFGTAGSSLHTFQNLLINGSFSFTGLVLHDIRHRKVLAYINLFHHQIRLWLTSVCIRQEKISCNRVGITRGCFNGDRCPVQNPLTCQRRLDIYSWTCVALWPYAIECPCWPSKCKYTPLMACRFNDILIETTSAQRLPSSCLFDSTSRYIHRTPTSSFISQKKNNFHFTSCPENSVRNREVLLDGSLIHRHGSAHAGRSRGPDSVPLRTPLASARRTFINLIVTCFYAVFKILLK